MIPVLDRCKLSVKHEVYTAFALFLPDSYQRIPSDPTRSIVVLWVKIFKTEKPIEIQLVRLTEVCG